MALPKLLSKTKLMRGYQCEKSIFLTIHHKELEPAITPEQQAIFDQGNAVGIEARKHFTNGTLIDNKPWDFFGSLKKTRELLAAKTPVIFEAAFEYNGCYARADIIQYSEHSGRWSIYEVKSSTKLKDEHLDDVGLQAWIMAKSGLPIEQINVMYINNACKYPNLSNLFCTEDVTEKLRQRYLEISPKISKLFSVLKSETIPNVDIGPHCFSPIECPFVSHCFAEKNIPELSIFNLPQIKNTKWDLYKQGILRLDDPRLKDLLPTQQRVVDVFKSQQRHIDIDGIRNAIKEWQFPLVFLDFETINPAIPRYENTTPYQQVPFQFSVHIWPNKDAELIHKEYLHTDAQDPRPLLIPALLEACADKGSIVAYYGQFESSRITELAEFSPVHKEKLEALLPRIVDPLPIIRDFIYDNAFHGSFSLKAVGPALLGESFSYDNMLVDNGTAAQRAFDELINPNTTKDRKNELIKASIEYCKKDTLVMVELVKWLLQITK